MIEFKNNGKVVTVEYNKEQDCYVLYLAKKMTFKAQSKFTIDTKLEINCDHYLDECIACEFSKDEYPIYIISERYTDTESLKNVVIEGYYAGDTDVEMPKGEAIGCIYCFHKCTEDNPAYVPQGQQNDVSYIDDTICIRSLDGKQRFIEQVINPDGTVYIKIPITEGENLYPDKEVFSLLGGETQETEQTEEGKE